MSAAIEAKINEYITLIQECLDEHLFNPTWSGVGDLNDKKKIIKDALQVQGINGTSLNFQYDTSWKDYDKNKVITGMCWKFEVNYHTDHYSSSTISIPYANLNWNNVMITLQKAFVNMWVNVERDYLQDHTDDLLDAKINFYNFVKKEWDDITAKLKAIQSKIVLNAFVLQKSGLDDRNTLISKAKSKMSNLEYELLNMLRREIATPWERVYTPRAAAVPRISIFGEYYDWNNPGWVKYIGPDPSGRFKYKTQGGGQGHVNTWSLQRYLPFTPYWDKLKDIVDKVREQKAEADAANVTTNP